jgi:DNA-binding GntR family transcriptional regulator
MTSHNTGPYKLPEVISKLELFIQQSRSTGFSHLPGGVRALARRFSVSVPTIRKALNVLRDRGAVEIRQGSGIMIPRTEIPLPAERTTAPVPGSQPRWQRIKKDISAGITDGRYKSETPFPSVKVLVLEYGSSNRVVSRALAELAREGRIVRHRRGHRVVAALGRSSQNTIVMVGIANTLAETTRRTPWTPSMLGYIDREFQHRNLCLDIWNIETGKRANMPHEARRINLTGKGILDHIVGYIVWTLPFAYDVLPKHIDRLARTGKPVCLFDEYTENPPLAMVTANPRFRVFGLYDRRLIGRDVGNHLLTLGHRRIACIAPVQGDGTQQRFAGGLQQAFTDAGTPDAVDAVVLPGIRHFRLEGEVVPGPDVYETLQNQKRLLSTPEASPVPMADNHYFDWLGMRYATQRKWATLLAPRFGELLHDTSITAWACYNDLLALVALEFLRGHDVDVPGRISVIGVDDSEEAMANSLTSYNFNTTAYVNAMLEHILAPARELRRPKPRLEIPGFIVRRASTDTPPKW